MKSQKVLICDFWCDIKKNYYCLESTRLGKLRPRSVSISAGVVQSKSIKTYLLDNKLRQSATKKCAKFTFDIFYILIT